MDEMTALCAADGRWSPDPVDVQCREIGMIIPAIHQVVLNSQYKSAEVVVSINEMACWHIVVFEMPLSTAKMINFL